MSHMRTTNFDAVVASAPLNRTASVVRDGSGEHWDPVVRATQAHWTSPPPMKSPPTVAPDLTGATTGRLRVVGYYGSSKKSGSRWVVRCTCGDYELRRSKAITNPIVAGDTPPMCCKCTALEDLKKQDQAIRRGRYMDGSPLKVGVKTSAGLKTLKSLGAAQ